MGTEYENLPIRSRQELRDWLSENHSGSPGVWVVTFKKRSDQPYVPYDVVVEEALCFGWIDSRGRAVDEERSALLLTPRKPTSRWSRPNKERIERLIAHGQMTPVGIRVVEAAKDSGTWTALDEVEALIEPSDLRAALDADPQARLHWTDFPRSAKRALLEWISLAKKPETRSRRIAETVTEAAANRRANQWPRPR